MQPAAAADIPESAPNGGSEGHSALVLATACPTLAFALWTIACQISVACHLSFATLTRIGPFAIAAGLVCGALSGKHMPGRRRQVMPAVVAVNWGFVALAAMLVGLHAVGIGYSAFWIAAVVLLSISLVRVSWTSASNWEPAPLGRGSKSLLFALVLIAPVLTYTAHRPNLDDAVYVGTAADVIAHPELPVLSHDVLYGDQKFPLMLPSYAVESYPLLIGFLAKLFGGAPIFWAHAIVPTLLAVLVPICWARLMRILVPKHWAAATVAALLAISLPADFRGLGTFSFFGLATAKAVLVSAGIPLLFASAWTFEESGSLRDWVLLAGATVACVGLSASAIFIVPLALFAAAVSGWRKGLHTYALLTFLPALYPLVCGLMIAGKFEMVGAVFAKLPARADLAATSVFGSHTEWIFLLGMLAAPFLQRDLQRRRLVTVLVLAYFLLALNPFTFKLLSSYTTRDAAWRLLWCGPVAGIVSAAVIGTFEVAGEQWGRLGKASALIIVLSGIAYLWQYSLFRSSMANYSLQPLKVNAPDYEAARAAIGAMPPGTSVLAPEAVAVWIPTFVHRVPLVSIRPIYDDEMGVYMPEQEAVTRRNLRELVSGTPLSSQTQAAVLDELPKYSVGLIVTTRAVADRLGDELLRRGYVRFTAVPDYVFFRQSNTAKRM